jgi:hypothetical protein
MDYIAMLFGQHRLNSFESYGTVIGESVRILGVMACLAINYSGIFLYTLKEPRET